MNQDSSSERQIVRPPIVAVLGHVDHGKTTLLDAIRKTTVAASEHGGITQRIGAYQVNIEPRTQNLELNDQSKPRIITFIDTPGHEAFMQMRTRGAKVADLALLVVAADDSVKPQTQESLKQIKAAGIPFIVVVNKVDLPTANVDKVKQDLARNEVQVVGFGGVVPIALVSAKSGTGLNELFATIIVEADKMDLRVGFADKFSGVVIETRVDKGKGMVSSVIVKTGQLKIGDPMYSELLLVGRVRNLTTDKGEVVKQATTGQPVEVSGFTRLPEVGSSITHEAVKPLGVTEVSTDVKQVSDLPDFLKPVSEQAAEKLLVIVKADTAGSLEAIVSGLDARIKIVKGAVGEITEADILLAKSSGAFIIGFGVKAKPDVEKLAQLEKVVVRIYRIIYELLEEMAEVVVGMKEVLNIERELGQGEIIAEFPYDNQKVAGVKVLSGRLARGDQVKIIRGDTETTRGKVKSLRHGREDISRADKGSECGIIFDRKVDFLLGDVIIAIT